MTDKVLNDYYFKNKDRFKSLSRCTCVSELLLKLAIYGKQWSEWDWLLLLAEAIENDLDKPAGASSLYDDFIQTIDNNSLLDAVFTKKNVILSLSYGFTNLTLHSARASCRQHQRFAMLLAHIFKKFPKLWMMSWMFAKFKDKSTKQWKKYHRLGANLLETRDKTYSYTEPAACYGMFISTYLETS